MSPQRFAIMVVVVIVALAVWEMFVRDMVSRFTPGS